MLIWAKRATWICDAHSPHLLPRKARRLWQTHPKVRWNAQLRIQRSDRYKPDCVLTRVRAYYSSNCQSKMQIKSSRRSFRFVYELRCYSSKFIFSHVSRPNFNSAAKLATTESPHKYTFVPAASSTTPERLLSNTTLISRIHNFQNKYCSRSIEQTDWLVFWAMATRSAATTRREAKLYRDVPSCPNNKRRRPKMCDSSCGDHATIIIFVSVVTATWLTREGRHRTLIMWRDIIFFRPIQTSELQLFWGNASGLKVGLHC